MDQLEADLIESPLRLTFLHLVDPDPVGHSSGWGSPEYLEALRRVDTYLSRLLELVEGNEPYAGRTTIILTADHGGVRSSHSAAGDPENYIIPFYVWGADGFLISDPVEQPLRIEEDFPRVGDRRLRRDRLSFSVLV